MGQISKQQMVCACGNTRDWRNLRVTTSGVSATCGKCGAQVTVPAGR